MQTFSIRYRPVILFLSLILFELILTGVYLSDYFIWTFTVDAFDLDLEGTFASWFSSEQLILISIFCLSIHQAKKNSPDYQYPQPIFLIACLLFLFLSMDESLQIHEKLNWKLVNIISYMPSFRHGHGAWMLPYALMLTSVLVYLRRSIILIWKKHKYAFYVSSIGIFVFITGAVLLEVISYQFFRDAANQNFYVLEVATEEFLEMFGSTIILYGVNLIYQDSSL